MKVVTYSNPDGTLAVMWPIEGARIAARVTLADGRVLKGPARADTFSRGWPIPGATVEWAETDDAFVARIAAKDVPAGATNVQIVEAATLPADRGFRGAWRHDAGGVRVDMPAARAIHSDRLRALRAPRLAALDVEYLQADEAGDVAKKTEIAARKKALRDVTKDAAIEAAATPEALASVLPAALRS